MITIRVKSKKHIENESDILKAMQLLSKRESFTISNIVVYKMNAEIGKHFGFCSYTISRGKEVSLITVTKEDLIQPLKPKVIC